MDAEKKEFFETEMVLLHGEVIDAFNKRLNKWKEADIPHEDIGAGVVNVIANFIGNTTLSMTPMPHLMLVEIMKSCAEWIGRHGERLLQETEH